MFNYKSKKSIIVSLYNYSFHLSKDILLLSLFVQNILNQNKTSLYGTNMVRPPSDSAKPTCKYAGIPNSNEQEYTAAIWIASEQGMPTIAKCFEVKEFDDKHESSEPQIDFIYFHRLLNIVFRDVIHIL